MNTYTIFTIVGVFLLVCMGIGIFCLGTKCDETRSETSHVYIPFAQENFTHVFNPQFAQTNNNNHFDAIDVHDVNPEITN